MEKVIKKIKPVAVVFLQAGPVIPHLERPLRHHVLRGVEWGSSGTGWGVIAMKVFAARRFFNQSENEIQHLLITCEFFYI